MGSVQRVPQGLLDVLSIKGVDFLPSELSRQVVPVLELLQYYGLQQQQVVFNNNPVLAEAGTVGTTNVVGDSANKWAILFGATATIGKTATMTAARISIVVQRNGSNGLTVASEEMGPFGATETGAANLAWVAPYPLLLRPPWDIRAFLGILGTDATASVSIVAELGLLG